MNLFKPNNRNPKIQFAKANEIRERKQNLFTTKAGPGETAISFPNPYPILGEAYSNGDVIYTGEDTDGDNVPTIASLYREGPIYDTPDMMHMGLKCWYLGLNISPDIFADEETQNRPVVNYPYNEQFVQSQIQVIANAYGTQLTEIPFFQYHYETSIPAMRDTLPAMIGMFIHYQTVIQNVAGLVGKYNTALSLTDYCIAMGYNNEAALTTQLFGLLHKANMFNCFEQVATLMQQEFLDIKWYKQASVLNLMPSRKSNSVVDALRTLTVTHSIPDIKIFAGASATEEVDPDTGETIPETPLYWFSKDSNCIPVVMYYDNNVQTEYFSMQDLFHEIAEQLDVFNIISWARQAYAQVEGVGSAELYANRLIAMLQALVEALNKWKLFMNDLKTLFQVIQMNTGLNNWILGIDYVSPNRPRSQVTRLVNFAIVRDIFNHYYTGGFGVAVDGNTKKWVVPAVWHRYDGIPSFTMKEGGFIMACFGTSPQVGTDDMSNAPYRIFPLMFHDYVGVNWFNYDEGYVYEGEDLTPPVYTNSVEYVTAEYNALLCTRAGYVSRIRRRTYSQANRPDFLARLFLVPFQADALTTLNLPYVLRNAELATEANLWSAIARFLLYEFGMSDGVVITDGANPVTLDGTRGIDPNIMGMVTRQYNNFGVNAIAFLKSNAPLRQSPDDVDIGFVFSK